MKRPVFAILPALLTMSWLVPLGLPQVPTGVSSQGTASKSRPIATEVFVDLAYDPSTPGWQVTRFGRIQEAILAVGEGGTVHVAPGVYPETLTVDKRLQLVGEDAATTVVVGDVGDVVVVNESGVEIRGLTVTRSGEPSDVGIRLRASSVVVEGCIVSSFYQGVLIDEGASQCVIEQNTISNSELGVRLEREARNNVIRDNRLSGNRTYEISLGFSDGNLITGNLADSAIYYGIDLYRSNDNEVSSNTLRFHTKDVSVQKSDGNRIVGNDISGLGYTGIEVRSSSGNLLQGNVVRDQYSSGLFLSGGTNTILDNVVENSSGGVYVGYATGVVVARNRLEGGIGLSYCLASQVTDNTLLHSGVGVSGPSIEYWIGHLIQGNTLNGRPVYYYETFSPTDQFQVPADAAQVIIANCENVAVRGLDLSDGGSVQIGFSSRLPIEANMFGAGSGGIRLDFSSRVQIRDNLMNDVGRSIATWSCDLITITGNVIEGDASGAWLYLNDSAVAENRFFATAGIGLQGVRNTFEQNVILDTNAPSSLYLLRVYDSSVRGNYISTNVFSPAAAGLLLEQSDHNVIEGNDVLLHRDGMLLEDCSFNTIQGNLLAANHLEGIRLGGYFSDDNVFVGNSILGGSYGFSVADEGRRNVFTGNTIADHRRGASLSRSENQIYDNSFVDVFEVWDQATNLWDDGQSSGNYFFDYSGVDADGDGVGDVPYPIPGGTNADRFPLMAPAEEAILYASDYRLSVRLGGTIELKLHGGPARAGRTYVLLGSATGRLPATPLPGGRTSIPLLFDSFTDFVFENLNSPLFARFAGQLDSFGEATSRLTLPPVPDAFAGTTLYFAFALASPWDVASNPVPIELRAY